MSEDDIREAIARQFAILVGGGKASVWARIPYINKIAHQIADDDALRWAHPDEINARIREAVLDYA